MLDIFNCGSYYKQQLLLKVIYLLQIYVPCTRRFTSRLIFFCFSLAYWQMFLKLRFLQKNVIGNYFLSNLPGGCFHSSISFSLFVQNGTFGNWFSRISSPFPRIDSEIVPRREKYGGLASCACAFGKPWMLLSFRWDPFFKKITLAFPGKMSGERDWVFIY